MSKGKYLCTVCEQDHSAGCTNLACAIGRSSVERRR